MISETIVLPKKIVGEENRFIIQLKAQLLKHIKEINKLQKKSNSNSDLSDYYTKEEVDDIVNTKLAELVSSAPETLDTLEELADALGDDPNFATTVTTQIGNKLDKTSPNYIKDISINGTIVTITKGDNTTLTETTQDTVPFVPTNVSELTNDSGYITGVAWGDITNKPTTFTPSTHTHNYAGSISAGGSATSVNTTSAAANRTRHVWFSYNNTDRHGEMCYNDKLQYNPSTNVLTVGSITGSAGSVAWGNVSDKPTFATVATSGSYTDLSDLPTIPAVPTIETGSTDGTISVDGTDVSVKGLQQTAYFSGMPIDLGVSGCTAIKSNSDLDNFTTAGTFTISGGNTGSSVFSSLSNKPSDVGGGKLIVMYQGLVGYPRQILFMNNGNIWTRNYASSAWSAWKKFTLV